MFYHDRVPAYLILIIVAFQLAIQISLLSNGEDFIITNLTYDDTYYYLQICWNLYEHGIFTFDGIHTTNGVQFLWFWILAAVTAFTPTKTDLLMATMYIVVALNAACYYPVWRIARSLSQPGIAVALAVPLFYLNVSDRIYLLAMENSLHLLILMLLAAKLLTIIQRANAQKMTDGDLVSFAALLALATWARLDSALFVAPLYGYVLWLYVGRHRVWSWRPILISGLVAGGMAALMFASFYLMGSTPLPVSGLIKQEKFNMGLGHFLPALLTWVLEHTNPVIKEIFAIVRAIRARETVSQPQAGLTTFLTGAIVIPWMLLEWRHYRSGRREGGVGWLQTIAPLGELYVVLMAVTLPHLVYISSFPQYMTWYRSPELLLSVLTMGLALHRIGWLARQSRAEELVSAHRAVAAAMVGTLALSGWSLGHDSLFVIEPKPNYRERVAIARWIDQHLAPETVVAAWSAGLLSYYSNRRVINLDGLANDTAFFREVLVDRSVSLPEYLQRNGVSLIIDHTIHDPRVLDHFVPVDISKNFARTRILQAPGFDLKPGLVQALLQTEHRTF